MVSLLAVHFAHRQSFVYFSAALKAVFGEAKEEPNHASALMFKFNFTPKKPLPILHEYFHHYKQSLPWENGVSRG